MICYFNYRIGCFVSDNVVLIGSVAAIDQVAAVYFDLVVASPAPGPVVDFGVYLVVAGPTLDCVVVPVVVKDCAVVPDGPPFVGDAAVEGVVAGPALD